MLTLQFGKFFNQGRMRFPSFHTLKHPYCHLRCIVRVFQVEKSYKNYLVWILFLWSKNLLYSEQDQLASSYLQIAFGLRSTWILVHGKWEQVEDRVPPLLQQSRFDKWIEWACFQYHHPTSAPVVSLPVSMSAAASFSVPTCVDVGTEQSEPHIQY